MKLQCKQPPTGLFSILTYYRAGVPQIILPVWADTYDFANRVEMIGTGRWGSRKAFPRWSASELGDVLVDVVLDRNGQFASKAKAVAEECKRRGDGRDIAAKNILEMIGAKL